MKRLIFLFITIFIGSLLFAQNAPYVYNVSGTQRTDGSKIVDIHYDVFDPDGDTLFVSLKVSADNGNTYDIIPADSLLSGDIGEGIMSGNGKHIIWQAGAEATTFAGNTFKYKVIANDNPTPPEGFVFVDGGTFNNGTSNVTVSSFYMAKTEVTQAEYTAIMGSNPAHSYGVGDNYPVYYVNWYSAIKYCNKKSINEGLTPCYSVGGDTNPDNWGGSFTPDVNWNASGYRLPTEAEWMFAAKGGNDSQGYTYSGSNTIDDVAWYHDNSASTSHPVGTKDPNELLTYDMSGNVWEWCWDWYGSYPSGAQTNPTGPSSGSARVLRGGSWDADADFCTVSHRDNHTPGSSGINFGFRLLRVSP